MPFHHPTPPPTQLHTQNRFYTIMISSIFLFFFHKHLGLFCSFVKQRATFLWSICFHMVSSISFVSDTMVVIYWTHHFSPFKSLRLASIICKQENFDQVCRVFTVLWSSRICRTVKNILSKWMDMKSKHVINTADIYQNLSRINC